MEAMSESMDRPMALPKVKDLIAQGVILLIALPVLPIMAVVHYIRKGDSSLLFMAAVFVAGTVYFALRHSALRLIRLARELDRDGMTTQGTVVDKLESRSEDRELHCDILYEYGESYQVWQKVSRKAFESLSVGDKITVRYLLRDPRYSRLEFK